MSTEPNAKTEFLRHTLATLSYRGGKALRGIPAGFESFRLGESTRTPVEILAHINDLLDWACHLAAGEHIWRDSHAQSWDKEVSRFYTAVQDLEQSLSGRKTLGSPAEKLFQGPIADALTHVGQIGMLRRLAGGPVRGENYFKADIVAGRVGREQAVPRKEFD